MSRTLISAMTPVIEVVRVIDLLHIDVERVGPAECGSLPALQFVSLTAPGGLGGAIADADHGVASVGAGLDAIVPGLEDGKRLVGRVDLEVVIFADPPHRNIDRARGQLDLNRVVIQIQK